MSCTLLFCIFENKKHFKGSCKVSVEQITVNKHRLFAFLRINPSPKEAARLVQSRTIPVVLHTIYLYF